MNSISVVIPAYNEEKRIVPTLRSIIDYFESKTVTYEIIVVDDGSRDNTASVVRQFDHSAIRLRSLEQNFGKFGAFRAGAQMAQHEWVLLYDADGATPIEALDAAIPFTKDAEVVIGSREVEGAAIQVTQPGVRHQLGRLGNSLIRAIAGLPFHDTQCGFKLMQTVYLQPAVTQMRVNRFAGDIELLFLLQQAGARIVEVGVPWHHIDGSTVKSTDYIQVLFDLIKIRINFILGKYRK